MTKKPTKAIDSDQRADFIKVARELGCDESEDAFDRVLRKVASAPPPKTVQRRKKTKRKVGGK